MPSWGLAGKLFKNISGYLTEMNPATLTGAIDVIIIRQEDGTFQTSPWHVRFGKMGCFWVNENSVDIEINGKSVDMTMKLGVAGEAFFLHDISVASEVSSLLA
ncbi:hypothetical protein HELRODRAFT_62962 [Helobdella robusta]|uniref:Lipin N-terminal domain-containing protein n=1 Tax=Helobdella robusta TaxID=6412 RepID=T1FX86_HELRO|nr:hypothetical protein HELRODRAFT_62962 [Helobdella robusta]ESO13178.1 hypothetical protein HELRODRAFT_62962 [Helobdella robusta]